MQELKRSIEDLAEIRQMMEASTRFVSLSGLSGVSAGLVALLGAGGTYTYLRNQHILDNLSSRRVYSVTQAQFWVLVTIAVGLFLLAGSLAYYFTYRNAKRRGSRMWTRAGRNMLFHLLFPLAGGALFCMLLAWHGFGVMVPSATLIFYGIAVINAGKFTHREIHYLGISQVVLGLISGLALGYGILFWAIGFGLLHILYGILMYWRYERGTTHQVGPLSSTQTD